MRSLLLLLSVCQKRERGEELGEKWVLTLLPLLLAPLQSSDYPLGFHNVDAPSVLRSLSGVTAGLHLRISLIWNKIYPHCLEQECSNFSFIAFEADMAEL